jgi:hypothetical protein
MILENTTNIEFQRRLFNYNTDLIKFNKRQSFREKHIIQLNFIWKMKYFLYETYIEWVYLIWLISIILIWLLWNTNTDNLLWYIFLWFIAFIYMRMSKKDKPYMDVWFIKSIWYMIWISLYIVYYNFSDNFVPSYNLFVYMFLFMIILPFIWYFYMNEEPIIPLTD